MVRTKTKIAQDSGGKVEILDSAGNIYQANPKDLINTTAFMDGVDVRI